MYSEKTTVNERGITLKFAPITVDSINDGLSDTKNYAQLRQKVTSIYSSARGHDSLSDALFGDGAFGQGNEYESERVAFVPVPVGTTIQQVQQKLAGLAEPKLVRFLSLKPILTEEQRRAMATGLSKDAAGNPITMEHYRNTQHIKDADGNRVMWIAPDGSQHSQYGVTKFHSSFIEDVDNRLEEWQAENPERIQVANATIRQSQTA